MLIENRCPYCLCSLSLDKKKVIKHINKVHIGKSTNVMPYQIYSSSSGNGFLCPICKTTILTKRDLDRHLSKNHKNCIGQKQNKEDIVITKKYISEVFDLNLYQKPVKQHANPLDKKFYYCPYCFELISMSHYFKHVHDLHSKKAFERKPISIHDSKIACPCCSERFKNIVDLRKHYSKNHVEKKVISLKEKTSYIPTEKKKCAPITCRTLTHDEYLQCFSDYLSKKNLYDKVFYDDLNDYFPNYGGARATVDELNDRLHKRNKEVTANREYYILVEPGTHAARVKDEERIRYFKYNRRLYTEGYRDDISNLHGSFHNSREENGRVSSSPVEDSYD